MDYILVLCIMCLCAAYYAQQIIPSIAVLRIQIQDPRSGAFLLPGSGINFIRNPDPQIRPLFW
jgi:hypothetical protein